jgi:hypothetical protein
MDRGNGGRFIPALKCRECGRRLTQDESDAGMCGKCAVHNDDDRLEAKAVIARAESGILSLDCLYPWENSYEGLPTGICCECGDTRCHGCVAA